MKILVDANVPGAEACFGPLGELVRLPGREIDAAALADIDILVIRSITRLDAATLDAARALGSPLRFVGTCTIGTDHVDQAALARHGISFASAPGCNAEAVVDYVLGSLLTLAERQGWRLAERRIGIVGVGNVGGRLRARLAAMGLDCLACDPPRAEAEGGEGYDDLDTLVEKCDVLCLHTPLVRQGPHATHHLLNAPRIARLTPGTVLLNAGRGDCVDGRALGQRLANAGDISVILDVWENEPDIDPTLRGLAELATPHIAGHSLDGKLRGTHQVYTALSRCLGLPARLALTDLLPAPPVSLLALQGGLAPEEALRLCLRTVYDVRRDHDSLLRESHRQGMAKGFDACRANYPLRREFSTLAVELGHDGQALSTWLQSAGLRLSVR
ncbi:4-phosphoerythronate dehydrogenase PdxB [Billgrantia saliphila]|uniref:4-phosphoerythronate dehydrogenase PdxB n=1 Tax=Billgrantia saliphila TaxID=1848458 RepID=UPI000CE45AC1|nr:4-phosphoerythronate dehydrogenase PdxB [Halomonas saliphila]